MGIVVISELLSRQNVIKIRTNTWKQLREERLTAAVSGTLHFLFFRVEWFMSKVNARGLPRNIASLSTKFIHIDSLVRRGFSGLLTITIWGQFFLLQWPSTHYAVLPFIYWKDSRRRVADAHAIQRTQTVLVNGTKPRRREMNIGFRSIDFQPSQSPFWRRCQRQRWLCSLRLYVWKWKNGTANDETEKSQTRA